MLFVRVRLSFLENFSVCSHCLCRLCVRRHFCVSALVEGRPPDEFVCFPFLLWCPKCDFLPRVSLPANGRDACISSMEVSVGFPRHCRRISGFVVTSMNPSWGVIHITYHSVVVFGSTASMVQNICSFLAGLWIWN